MLYDCDSWNQYPHHRWVFNKLELALRLGHTAGPGGVAVPKSDSYIIRPIYNLSGMGLGARIRLLDTEDCHTVGPGEFWCERFCGHNISVDYEWHNNELMPVFASQGIRTSPDLYRFNAWIKIEPPRLDLPDWIQDFSDVGRINIEFIQGHIIEIHLRPGIDFPENSRCIIPIWADMSEAEYTTFLNHGYQIVLNPDNADGHLPVSRIGFFYK